MLPAEVRGDESRSARESERKGVRYTAAWGVSQRCEYTMLSDPSKLYRVCLCPNALLLGRTASSDIDHTILQLKIASV